MKASWVPVQLLLSTNGAMLVAPGLVAGYFFRSREQDVAAVDADVRPCTGEGAGLVIGALEGS